MHVIIILHVRVRYKSVTTCNMTYSGILGLKVKKTIVIEFLQKLQKSETRDLNMRP